MARHNRIAASPRRIVPVADFEEAVNWIRELRQDDPALKVGGKGIAAISDALAAILDAGKKQHSGMTGLKPGRKKQFNSLYQLGNKSNALLSQWARAAGKDECPRVFKEGDTLGVEWADLPDLGVEPAERVWILLPRWWDEYVDEFLRGARCMAEMLGLGSVVRTVDSIDAIPDEIAQIIRDHTPDASTASIVVLFGNSAELKENVEVARERKRLERDRKGRLLITTVGHEFSEIRISNEEVGQNLAEQMLSDLAAAGALSGKVVVFGTEKVQDNAFKIRRGMFRARVDQRRNEPGEVGHGHELIMPDAPEIPETPREEVFNPEYAWRLRDFLYAYLTSREGRDVRAVYTQTTLFTLAAGTAIRDAGRTNDILLYGEYVSPSLLRWLWDDNWPLRAICGIDPYAYGRLVLRVAATRIEEHIRPIVISPMLITRDMVCGGGRLTYMVDLPRFFPDKDVLLDTVDVEAQNDLGQNVWYKKLRENARQARARGKDF